MRKWREPWFSATKLILARSEEQTGRKMVMQVLCLEGLRNNPWWLAMDILDGASGDAKNDCALTEGIKHRMIGNVLYMKSGKRRRWLGNRAGGICDFLWFILMAKYLESLISEVPRAWSVYTRDVSRSASEYHHQHVTVTGGEQPTKKILK